MYRPAASRTSTRMLPRFRQRTALGNLVKNQRRITSLRGLVLRTSRGGAVIGVNISFQYEGSFDRDRVTGIADNARVTFEGMPGLRFKFFTFDEAAQRASNFYVWDSKQAAENFFSDE